MFTLRRAEPRDEATVVALWQRVFGYPQARNAPGKVWAALCDHGTLVLLAVRAEEVVGTVVAGYDGHRGWLYRLAVAPEARRQGIGTALVREAERELRALGCAKINVQLLVSNREAAEFWAATGYQVEERISMGKDLIASVSPGEPGC